jgi:hypothetical protein
VLEFSGVRGLPFASVAEMIFCRKKFAGTYHSFHSRQNWVVIPRVDKTANARRHPQITQITQMNNKLDQGGPVMIPSLSAQTLSGSY